MLTVNISIWPGVPPGGTYGCPGGIIRGYLGVSGQYPWFPRGFPQVVPPVDFPRVSPLGVLREFSGNCQEFTGGFFQGVFQRLYREVF